MHTHDAEPDRPQPRGIVPTGTETIRLNAYLEGRRSMRDKIANDLALFAEGLPTECADYIWVYIKDLQRQIIT